MSDPVFRVQISAYGHEQTRNAFDVAAVAASQAADVIAGLSRGAFDSTAAFAALNNVSQLTSGFLGNIASTASSVFAGMLSLAKGAAETASGFEQLSVRFDAIFGEGGGAAAALAWARKFGAETPLTLDEVSKRMIRLKAAGFDPLNESLGLMRKLGDTTFALGIEFDRVVGALGKMNLTGKVTMESLNQLAEAGVPVFQIMNERLGVTKEELSDIAKIGLDGKMVALALADAMGEKYSGAMVKAASTAEGAFSTIKDLVTEVQLSITDQGPWEEFRLFVVSVRDELTDLVASSGFKAIAKDIGEGAKWWIEGISNLAQNAMFWIRSLTDAYQAWQNIDQWRDNFVLLSGADADMLAKSDEMLKEFQTRYSAFMDAAKKKKDEAALGAVVSKADVDASDKELDKLAKKEEARKRKNFDMIAKLREKDAKAAESELEKSLDKRAKLLEKSVTMQKSETKRYRDYEREIEKQALRDQVKAAEEFMAAKRKQLEYENKLAKMAADFAIEQENRVFKRKQEDAQSLLSRRNEDLMERAQNMLTGQSFMGYDPELDRLFNDVLRRQRGMGTDEEAKKLRRYFEDEERKMRRAQEDDAAQRDFKQKREQFIREEQTKAMIELATSLKNFKAQVDAKVRIIDQAKFVESFMEQVYERAGVIARAEAIPVAGV